LLAGVEPIDLSKGSIDPLATKIFIDDRQPRRSIGEKGIQLGFTTLDFFPLLIPLRYIARDDSITT